MAKRILLAAEFLRGDATLARLLPLADALAKRGNDIALAAPSGLRDTGFTTYPAPRWAIPPPPGFVAISYADVLMHGGYATPDALRGLMDRWQDVLVRARPDLLVADFAPTAMLAARVAGVPMAAVGDGFSLPPLQAPMPALRPWADIAPDALASVEGRVLAVINACLPALDTQELHDLRDLFAGLPAFLCTFPELDHYPDRSNGIWYGDVFPPSPGTSPDWPEGRGERIYIELDPRHPALPMMADALDRLGLPTVIQSAGLPTRLAKAMARRTVSVSAEVDRAAALFGSDIVVCQRLEVAAPALLAGKKLLMLPVFVEEMMTLHRVVRQGFGHGAAPDSEAASLGEAVRRLIDDRACGLRAVNFGRNYDGYASAGTVDAVAEPIQVLLIA